MVDRSRTPDIVADAAHAILTRPLTTTGRFFIDEDVLREEGVTDRDLLRYAVNREVAERGELEQDLFLDPVAPAKL